MLKIDILFLLNNLIWPIDAQLGVTVAYIKVQLIIATNISLIKVKAIVH